MEMPRRASAVRVLAALALLPLLGACATPEPDVVATQVPARKDGGSFSFTELHTCLEGRYGGSFASNSADGGFASTLKGSISFELVRRGSGEFLSVKTGDKLEGHSEQGDQFSAEIDSDNSGCTEGNFTTQLINGAYTPVGTTNQYPFKGTVEGKYLASDSADGIFLGTWASYFLDVQIAEGSWTAIRFGPSPAP
jgi:hypothetical protein